MAVWLNLSAVGHACVIASYRKLWDLFPYSYHDIWIIRKRYLICRVNTSASRIITWHWSSMFSDNTRGNSCYFSCSDNNKLKINEHVYVPWINHIVEWVHWERFSHVMPRTIDYAKVVARISTPYIRYYLTCPHDPMTCIHECMQLRVRECCAFNCYGMYAKSMVICDYKPSTFNCT